MSFVVFLKHGLAWIVAANGKNKWKRVKWTPEDVWSPALRS